MDFDLEGLNEINLTNTKDFASTDIDLDFNFDNEIPMDELHSNNSVDSNIMKGGNKLILDDIDDSGNESMNLTSGESENDTDNHSDNEINNDNDNENTELNDVNLVGGAKEVESEVEENGVVETQNYTNLLDEIENEEDNILLGGSNNESENNNSNNEVGDFLELERGVIVKLKKNNKEEYLIVKVKDVYFDDEKDIFIKNYQVRLLKDKKIQHELIDINSTEIESFIPLKEVYANNKEIEYLNPEDKDLDLTVDEDVLERLDPNSNDDELDNDMDLDIEIDSEMKNNINEEGFEFEEIQDGDVIIQVEKELEESKILFTENEQEEDIIDELIRRLPDRKKQDRTEIKKIIKLVNKFKFLKNKHSESGLEIHKNKQEDEIIQLKQNIILKTSNYKPLLIDYIHNNFNNEYLIPIINSNLVDYLENNDNDKDRLSDLIVNQIEMIEKINQKYKNNRELDFENLNQELDFLLKDKTIDNKFNTQYLTRFNDDTLVVNNLDVTEDDEIDLRNILGKDEREGFDIKPTISNKGERINIIGYMRLPKSVLDLRNKVYNLGKNKINESLLSIYKKNLKERNYEVVTLDYNNRYEIGDKVKVCILTKKPEKLKNIEEQKTLEIVGKIVESRRGFIYLEPDDEKLIDKNADILEFDTNSEFLKISKVENIKKYNAKCNDNNLEKIVIYEFPSRIINEKQKENMLDQIVPSIKQILDNEHQQVKKIYNFGHIKDILSKYNLHYSDLEKTNFKRLDNVLLNNEKKQYQKTLVDYAKINRDKTNYNKTLKEQQENYKKKDLDFIKNLDLQASEGIYENYDLDKFSFDDEEERIRWLKSQEDKGKFLLYSKKLESIQKAKLKYKLSNLEDKLKETQTENEKIKQKLDEENRKNEYFNLNKGNECREIETRIVKIYKNINELRQDNFRKITVDDRYVIGDKENPINLVKVGDYCVLKNENDVSSDINMKDKIFKRIEKGEDKKEIWVLQSKLKIADYLRETQRLCSNLVNKDGTPSFCDLDVKKGQCMPEKIVRLKKAYLNNELLVEKLEEQISKISSDEKEKLLLEKIQYYKTRGKYNLLNVKERVKKHIRNIEKIADENPVEIDSSKNNNYEYLKQLNEELKNPETKNDALNKLKDKYGIDFIEKPITSSDDVELFTQGDFDDKGQRIELTEVIENNRPVEIEQSNSDILDAIRSFLSASVNKNNYEDSYLNNDIDLLEIIQGVIQSITNIMGIPVDINKIDKICAVLVEDNLMSKSDFINNKYLLKGKEVPKSSKVDNQYNNYRSITIIFLTVSRLLIYLQVNLTNYFMLPYKKCISSIYGYPLVMPQENEEPMTTGVEYLACILENLKDSGKYWSCLEDYNRGKIQKKIMSYMSVVLDNQSLTNSLQDKFEDLQQKKLIMDSIEKTYIWNEFRPPLSLELEIIKEPPTVDLADTNMKNKKSFDNAVLMFNDRSLWIASKIVDRINNIISTQEIENVKYDPIPLGNSCCLSELYSSYSYFDFLNKHDLNKDLQVYLNESRNMEYLGSKLKKNDTTLIRVEPSEYTKPIISYKNNIFPTKKNLQNNPDLVKNFYKNFVHEGYYKGTKRIYKNNFCSYTGKKLSEISSANYSTDDFINLLNINHKKNSTNILPSQNEIILIEDRDIPNFGDNLIFKIKKLKNILDNKLLRENEYINDLVEKELDKIIEKKTDNIKIWDLLERNVKNCQDELLGKMSRNLDKVSIQNLKTILANLEIYDNLENMDKIILQDEEETKNSKELEIKLLELRNKRLENQYKNYIINYLCKYIYLLSNSHPDLDIILDAQDDSELRLRKSQRTLIDIKTKELDKLNKFRNKNCKNLFRKLIPIIRDLNEIKKINGNHNIFNNYESKFNAKNSYLLLKLIFFHIMINIIDINNIDKNNKKNKKLSQNSVSLSDDDEEENEDIQFKQGTSSSVIMSNYVFTIFQIIDKERLFKNKYSQITVEKNIKTKNEENKEKNLRVMQLLDIETRKLRNEMTNAGLTQYANLSKDFQKVVEQEENNILLREEYKKSVGEAYTDDGFERFKENREKEMRIENDIKQDNEQYLDAEGDDEMEI